MAQGADDVEEKRVFRDRAGETELLVAASIGVLSVAVSEDRVGRFGVAHRCDPADVAASGGRAAVATGEDVFVRDPGDDEFEGTGFGPAVAVGFDGDAPVAAGPEDRVARLGGALGDGEAGDAGDADRTWTDLGRIDSDVRAIDGRLVATADGVYRLPDLDYAGLDDARDVAAAGPLVATGDGLYSLGNGWMDELEGAFDVVTVEDDRAHAATPGRFYERRSGEWREVALPVEDPVADVAYGDVVYVVTAGGVVLAEGEDGWRARSLGVEGVVGSAIVGGR